MTITFLLVKASSPSTQFSFPYQDFFVPPNGRLARDPAVILMNIIPPSSFFPISCASNISSQTTTAESQKSVPFARVTASSMVE